MLKDLRKHLQGSFRKPLQIRKPKSQPMRAPGQPARRPGQHYQNYVGIDPKALVELKRIEDNTMNEVERNEAAIQICMKHLIEQSKEAFENSENAMSTATKVQDMISIQSGNSPTNSMV